MPHKTFFWFFFPSGLAMIIFIGLPIFSSLFQSLHIETEQILIEVETCDPFGCETEVQVDQDATNILRAENPLGRFNGFKTYTDRNHLAVNEIAEAWKDKKNFNDFISSIMNLPFYKGLLFTLTFCFAVTPCVIVLGFIVALSVNVIAKSLKGPIIFGTILPMIVTPLIGSLVLFWMIDPPPQAYCSCRTPQAPLVRRGSALPSQGRTPPVQLGPQRGRSLSSRPPPPSPSLRWLARCAIGSSPLPWPVAVRPSRARGHFRFSRETRV